jgi:hypothetical protein
MSGAACECVLTVIKRESRVWDQVDVRLWDRAQVRKDIAKHSLDDMYIIYIDQRSEDACALR